MAASIEVQLVPVQRIDPDTYVRVCMRDDTLPQLVAGGLVIAGANEQRVRGAFTATCARAKQGIMVAHGITTSGAFAGMVTIEQDSDPYLEYWVAGPYRRKGLATTAVNEALDRYFAANSNVAQIVTEIKPSNTASRKLAEKVGGVFMGMAGAFERWGFDRG